MIKNVDYIVIERTLQSSKLAALYPMQTGEPDDIFYPDETNLEKADKRSKNLAGCKSGSGHDNFLKGIIVQFDLNYSQFFALQFDRYNWFDFVSSQSKMHKILKMDSIAQNCNKWVLNDTIQKVDAMINLYDEKPVYPIVVSEKVIENEKELFNMIISNSNSVIILVFNWFKLL